MSIIDPVLQKHGSEGYQMIEDNGGAIEPARMKYSPNFHFSIAAYDVWQQDDVLDLAEDAYRELIAAHIARPGFLAHLFWSGMAGGKHRNGVSKTLNWRLPRKLTDLEIVVAELMTPNPGAPIHWDRGTRLCATLSPFDQCDIQFYEVSLKPQVLYGGAVPADVQRAMVSHAKAAYVRLGGVVGYITLDWVAAVDGGGWAPYERWLRISVPLAAVDFQTKEKLFYRRTRGYYWGNFLNANHVDILGGEQALSRAPVALVERLENGWYLQLTDDINDIDRGRLHELRDFLVPVLPVAYYDTRRPPDYEKTLPALVL